MQKGLPNRCRPRGRGRSPGSCRPGGQGRLRTSGVCSASSRRQSASGRSGPGSGRSSAGTALGKLFEPLQGATPGSGWALRRGAMRACGPLETSPRKEDSAESRVKTVGLGAASGPGSALQTPGNSQRSAGLRRRANSGPRAGRGAGGPQVAAAKPAVTESTTASSGFCPKRAEPRDHPRRGWRKAGKGRERGGACGATSHGPLRAAPGCAPPVGHGSRPGPAQGGGARRHWVLCAVVATRKPATRVGRPKGGKP